MALLASRTAGFLLFTSRTAAAFSATTLNMPYVVGVDGTATMTDELSRDFLLNRPNGAYTTARTCSNAKRLFEWRTHIERTACSAAAMIEEADEEALSSDSSAAAGKQELLAELGDPSRLGPRIDGTVSAAIDSYVAAHGRERELKVTVLVSWAQEGQAAPDPTTEPHEQLPAMPYERGLNKGLS